MDNIFSKIGLYDVFGVFVSGLIAVVVSISLRFPILFNVMGSDTENIICFLVISYFVGLVLQEIGSVIAKYVKYEKRAETRFLNEEWVLENKTEMDKVKEYAVKILNVPQNHTFSEDENQYVYSYCLNYLETRGKEDKIKRINALYAMSRSISCFCGICLVAYIVFEEKSICHVEHWCVISALCTTMALFIGRTSKFAKYKVKVVLEHYIAIKKKG